MQWISQEQKCVLILISTDDNNCNVKGEWKCPYMHSHIALIFHVSWKTVQKPIMVNSASRYQGLISSQNILMIIIKHLYHSLIYIGHMLKAKNKN